MKFCVFLLVFSFLIPSHAKLLASRIRFLGVSQDGIVHYQFREGDFDLKLTTRPNQMKKNTPLEYETLIMSYQRGGEWVLLSEALLVSLELHESLPYLDGTYEAIRLIDQE